VVKWQLARLICVVDISPIEYQLVHNVNMSSVCSFLERAIKIFVDSID
jgi:hypothetical protein